MATVFAFMFFVSSGQVLAQTDKERIAQLEKQLSMVLKRLDAAEKRTEKTITAVESFSSRPRAQDKISLGGYGEIHYNNYDAKVTASDTDKLDFHRFVSFVNYEYSDKLRLFSEFELEHSIAGDGQPGEIELEQAYIEYDITDNTTLRGGLSLIPIGIMNETHDPPTFYGVERNNVEAVIIPGTWWAGGVGLTHNFGGGFSADLMYHEGLKISAANVAAGTAYIRDGRQKTGNADASHWATTARLKYTGILGLEIAASFQHQDDLSQIGNDAVDDGDLFEAHVVYEHASGFGLRALYAEWDIDTDSTWAGTINGLSYDDQDGYYIEPSWQISPSFGVFVRTESVEGGRSDKEFDTQSIGFNWWIDPKVVVKVDYYDIEFDNVAESATKDADGYNIGIGYMF
jgi:hypothetical protein